MRGSTSTSTSLRGMPAPARFVVIGAGYRAQFFWQLAAPLAELDCVGVVVRTPRELPVPTYTSFETCLRETKPDFVITSTPWAVTPVMIMLAVDHGLPVLAETPPAPDVPAMTDLWDRVGGSGLVQVAEQYLLLPSHAARLAVVRSGAIGTPTQAHVSSTQYYHAVSLIRGFLDVGREPVSVRASSFTAPLVNPLNRQRWTGNHEPQPTRTVLATLDFGERSGLYDFTDNQTRNPLRSRRTMVRGSHGELSNDEVVRFAGPESVVTTPLVRRQTGHDLDLDGYDTDHVSYAGRVVYRSPVFGHRWNDDEVAIATLMLQMADWVRGSGPEPYPLADGCYDHQVGLAIDESIRTDSRVEVNRAPWVE